MGEVTGIEWTDSTFNPWRGCQRVSPGCVNCYAEALTKRWGNDLWGPKAPRERTTPANWRNPEKWHAAAAKLKKRHRVFCASLADVFEDRDELAPWRSDLFALIRRTPWLDWQLLTKRPENLARFLPGDWGLGYPNVWLGTTVEDQERAELRIPLLTAVPAVVHFLSVEPLLASTDLGRLYAFDHVEWVIAGGESGPNCRPMQAQWAREVRDACVKGGVAFFFKQWGHARNNPDPKDTTHGKGGSALDGVTWKQVPVTEVARAERGAA